MNAEREAVPAKAAADRQTTDAVPDELTDSRWLWAIAQATRHVGAPFDAALVRQAKPPPHAWCELPSMLEAHGLRCTIQPVSCRPIRLPCIVYLAESKAAGEHQGGAGLATAFGENEQSLWIASYSSNRTSTERETVERIDRAAFEQRVVGESLLFELDPSAAVDSDSNSSSNGDAKQPITRFGLRWFQTVLSEQKRLWHAVLLASLVLQLIGLVTPLVTQVIIDKVVVHHTVSTLIAMMTGLGLFAVFSALLGWTRQLLLLHIGNQVDGRLGAAVFERLFRLPLRYFDHRPTGVITARMHGVEVIREFIASAVVTLVLDLPFLAVFVGIMCWYHLTLTLIVLVLLACIALLSVAVTPEFRRRLDQQFLLGARNQAFLTEHVSGMETVKSLQLEPQLTQRWRSHLASYLTATMRTRELSNSYNVSANLLEQVMTLSVLGFGAWFVMSTGPNDAAFTIGMLVAFQMFASKLSQPVLRLVGLWQQFQQARVAMSRLADIMDAPEEPYVMAPRRGAPQEGNLFVEGLAFRHAADRPLLYEKLSFRVKAGSTVAIVGASGSGKSTLAKLLLGFYQPTAGCIRIDGIDIRLMAANELRRYFGVVPQETMLFSGTVYDNLLQANPQATFDNITRACRAAGIHDVIEALPGGYKATIGERGAGLSGGQKQRVAIARALLKRPKLLIFDEATSALDEETAERFAAIVNDLHGHVTMLFITHRLPAALRVDQTVRLGER